MLEKSAGDASEERASLAGYFAMSGQHTKDTDDKTGFTVSDRRRFTSEGEPRERVGDSGEAATDANRSGEISFSGFVIGLAQQAFVALGLVDDSGAAEVRKDLPQAKATIDVLSMLRDKTKGNLDEVESRMMDDVLDELRLRYVREHRGAKKG